MDLLLRLLNVVVVELLLLLLLFDGLYVVLFTDQSASSQQTVSVAGYQPTVTRDTRETRHVIDGAVLMRFHDELVGRDRLATRSTCSRQAKHAAHTQQEFTVTAIRPLHVSSNCLRSLTVDFGTFAKAAEDS